MLDLDAIRTRLANKPRYLDAADLDNIMRYNAWLLAAPGDIASLLAEVARLSALEQAIHRALGFGDLTLSYGAHHPNDIHCHLLAFDENGDEFEHEADGPNEAQAINNTLNTIVIKD